MKIRVIFLVLAVTAGMLFSGCVNKSTNSEVEQVSATPAISPTPVATPVSTEVSLEQNKINELENKINSLQQQVNELQTRINRVDLLKPSSKKLLPPNIPFRLEVYIAEWRTPLTYTLKDNGEVEIKEEGSVEIASYKLFRDNNTIKLNSKKYNYYGIVLYDDYATAIYENGWIEWAYKYKVFPPTYNPLTQKYELG